MVPKYDHQIQQVTVLKLSPSIWSWRVWTPLASKIWESSAFKTISNFCGWNLLESTRTNRFSSCLRESLTFVSRGACLALTGRFLVARVKHHLRSKNNEAPSIGQRSTSRAPQPFTGYTFKALMVPVVQDAISATFSAAETTVGGSSGSWSTKCINTSIHLSTSAKVE